MSAATGLNPVFRSVAPQTPATFDELLSSTTHASSGLWAKCSRWFLVLDRSHLQHPQPIYLLYLSYEEEER
jgi:hypothetical protein